MIRLYVRHAVEDFEKWRKGYDTHGPLRAAHGVTGDGVHQGVDDPNDLTVWHDFETPEEASAFVNSPGLKGAMDELGVKGAPIVWITQQV